MMLGLDVIRVGSVRKTGDGRFLLEVLPAYRAGLDGLVPGTRVQVLYWMHELTHSDRRSLRVHPRGDESTPMRGVFSLRSPMRPNPIGVTEVDVVEVREAGLVVVGLDARDGSPLIDIKAVCR
ncbi:MAG: tRNA (N6-threonylcarbamoyladenosine(37)-N6)-methyltransferase TrmO [Polyangiaceae bacterium]|jgi:L-fuculose-phosphate aldolase|nr:tRNA (N6-threonylcarbamoyladenosine(37)-N6)-methyltransferase TrmO [Polyangiaceae bacterium]